MNIYAVFKKGVYRHECGGLFSSPEKAIEAAKTLAHAEPDDYHCFEIVPFELDIQTPRDVNDQSGYYATPEGEIAEPKACFSIVRDKHGVVRVWKNDQ